MSMTKRTQADRDEDLAIGRQLERKDAEIARLRSAATNLMAAIDNMHERGETFTARVSIAAADMRSALT